RLAGVRGARWQECVYRGRRGCQGRRGAGIGVFIGASHCVGCAFLSRADDRIMNVCGVMLLAVPSMKPITFPSGAVSFFRATMTDGSVMKFSSSMRAPFVHSNAALK